MSFLWITLGGAVGTAARLGLSGLIVRLLGEAFPWGTLVVNVTGSFAIGFFFTVTGTGGRWLVSPLFRQFFMLGICGGYTTFSSFSLQTLLLAEKGQWHRAGANVLFSVVACLAAVWFGHFLAMTWN
jgi:CrcB protein